MGCGDLSVRGLFLLGVMGLVHCAVISALSDNKIFERKRFRLHFTGIKPTFARKILMIVALLSPNSSIKSVTC